MAVSTQNSSIRRKLALIIANDNYDKLSSKLNYSCNNANDLKSCLEKINFDAEVSYDSNKQRMHTCIIQFSKTIQDGDLVIVYFSGHACGVDQKNYLIPIDDMKIGTERDVDDFAVNIERQLERLVNKNPSGVTILIVDCGKPYLLKNATASTTAVEVKALSTIKPPAGAFIQISGTVNQTIRNNRGADRNSLFTKHLLKNIARENIDFTDVFRDITKEVDNESKQQQRPLAMNGFQQKRQVYLNEVIKPVEPKPKSSLDYGWDENTEGSLQKARRAEAQLRVYYDNFPSIEDVTNDTRPSMKEAKKLTESILSDLPSGMVTERTTACHVLKNLLQTQNIDCLFFDSSHGPDLHDSSALLAEIESAERPFVLKLESSEGLGDTAGPKTEHGSIRLSRLLTNAIQQTQTHPIIEDVRDRLSKAHRVNKENICLKSTFVGSFNVVYTIQDWSQNGIATLAELPKRLKDQFEQFTTTKLHPLLCRPAFDISMFAAAGNKVFSNTQETHEIGPPGRTQTYMTPAGWSRYGLKVVGKYENGDTWLDPFQDPGNWYRAFHGTGRASAADFDKSKQSFEKEYESVDAMASIHKTGFRSARVAAYGAGTYCSPDPAFPETGYVRTVECDTQQGKKKFKCMIQVAVNPDGVTLTSHKQIWVVPNGEDIRPYGILIKEV